MTLNPKKIAGLDTGRLGLWNPANLLTFFRLIAGLFAILAFEAGWVTPTAAIIIIALSAATDLDGFVARRLNCSSAFGQFLDPLVDKLFIAIVGVWSLYRVGSLWPLVLALVVIHLLISFYAMRNIAVSDIKGEQFGKVAMAATFMSMVLTLYAYNAVPENTLLKNVAGISLALAFVLEVINYQKITSSKQ